MGDMVAGPAVEPMLAKMPAVVRLTTLSLRTVKRLTAANEIWGIVRVGRSVRYDLDEVRDWIKAGCPRAARGRSKGGRS